MFRYALAALLISGVARAADEPATLHVESEPSGAVISIDGVLLGLAPRDEVVTPGIYTVTAELKGRPTVSLVLNVVAGEQRRIKLRLNEPPRVVRFPLAGVVTTALGAAVMTTGLVLRFPAEAKTREMNALLAQGGIWDANAQAIERDGRAAQTWSWALIGSGAAITVAGLIVTAIQLFAHDGQPALTISPIDGGALAAWNVRW